MRFSRLMSAPVRRSVLGLILIGIVVFPGGTGGGGSAGSRSCQAAGCKVDGAVRWSRPLAGSWIAEDGVEGTVVSGGQAYAAIGDTVAAIGFGLTVDAFNVRTGFRRWTTTLSGLPAGSAIVSVRTWPGVLTVGVAPPPITPVGQSGAGQDASAPVREEVVLNAETGNRIAAYRAASYGGAVSAGVRRTVIVGPTSVSSYANATGKAVWRDPTGPAGQAWRVDGDELYVTVSAGGEIGAAPVTAVRQVNVRTGAERLLQPPSGEFEGRLSGALDGILLFSGTGGLSMYSEATGRLIARRNGAVPESVDPVQQVLYVDIDGAMTGIDPVTGLSEPHMSFPGPGGTYDVRAGVALGLDSGANGSAWGYSLAKKRVIWTTLSLPWPHYFVDLSGIGGSADQANGSVLLVTCAKAGQAVQGNGLVGGSAVACLRPMLVAIQR